MTERNKRPSFQFYPDDWQADSSLQMCSLLARGLWIELICVMHQCKPYGHLEVNGQPIPEANAARMVRATLAEYRRGIAELERAKVFERTASGTIYSKRMVKDEHIRNVRSESGSKGGNPNLLKQNADLLNQTSNQIPTPSASASASSSTSFENRDVGVTQPSTPAANGKANGNGAVKDNVRQERLRAKGMDWGNPKWVAETAKTVERPRRPNESEENWKDAVFEAVRKLQQKGLSDWKHRRAAKGGA